MQQSDESLVHFTNVTFLSSVRHLALMFRLTLIILIRTCQHVYFTELFNIILLFTNLFAQNTIMTSSKIRETEQDSKAH